MKTGTNGLFVEALLTTISRTFEGRGVLQHTLFCRHKLGSRVTIHCVGIDRVKRPLNFVNWGP